MTRIWDKLRYVRVDHIANRVQARKARRERASFLRFLRQTEYIDLAARVQRIHDDSRLDGETKRQQFEVVLNDYAARVTTAAAATSVAVTRDLEMHGRGVDGAHEPVAGAALDPLAASAQGTDPVPVEVEPGSGSVADGSIREMAVDDGAAA